MPKDSEYEKNADTSFSQTIHHDGVLQIHFDLRPPLKVWVKRS